MDFTELGYWGMFLAAFLAATILPFGSEPVLLALLYANLNPVWLLVAATLGNTLGGYTSYGLGYLGKWHWLKKWFGLNQKQITKAQNTIERFGVWSALLCWVPIIGDPIAIILGFFRISFWKVALLMAIGKLARYWAIIYWFE